MPDLAGEGGAYESGSVDDVLEVSQSPEGFLFLGMMERTLVDFPRGGGGTYVSRSTPTWRHVRVPNLRMTMVAKGAKTNAVRRGELLGCSESLDFRATSSAFREVGLPMDIERPPTKAKSMGLAPGKVLELR